MLLLCFLNTMIVSNTFYQHKEIYKYTKSTELERKINNRLPINRKPNRSYLLDCKVRGRSYIGNDHYLLTNKNQTRSGTIENKTKTNIMVIGEEEDINTSLKDAKF